MLRKYFCILLCMTAALIESARGLVPPGPGHQTQFIGIKDFGNFTTEASTNANESILLSPVIAAPLAWNQLIVSWNADAPDGGWLKVEARGIYGDHQTKYYTMGIWSKNSEAHPRTSVRGQKDQDGTVKEDTLFLARPGPDLQLRITLSGTNEAARPRLRFLGLCFSDTNSMPVTLPPNRAAWGKIIDTPELTQHAGPKAAGWCSPTAVAMDLSHWGDVLHRPEMKLDVPTVAAGVYDDQYRGTGNWPFNTAFAGSFPGMRAYVTRFSDVREVEDWIVAGIPVIISARWDMMEPGRPFDDAGHLQVCIGFTKEGDFVINDPATHLDKGQKVRRIYKRENVIKAWATSYNTVYLVYPENAHIPPNRFGQWEKP